MPFLSLFRYLKPCTVKWSDRATMGVQCFHVTISNSKMIILEVFGFYIPTRLKMTLKYIFSSVYSLAASFILKIQHLESPLNFWFFNMTSLGMTASERNLLVIFSSLDSDSTY